LKARAKLSDLIDSLDFPSDDYILRYDREEGRTVMTEQSILSALEEGESEKELKDNLPNGRRNRSRLPKLFLMIPEIALSAHRRNSIFTSTATWSASSAT
jgi:hypothetical protein